MSTPVVTARGTTSGKVIGTTTSTLSVTVGSTGSSILADIIYDTTVTSVSTIDWNGTLLSQDKSQGGSTFNTDIWSLGNATAGTHTLTVTWGATGALFFALAVSEVSGIAASPLDKTAGNFGSSTSPSSGATATTTQANEMVWGAVGTNGPNGDTAGTWSNSFTAGQRVGTAGGVATTNGTISEGYLQVSATGAQTAAKTGITSRAWSAAVATYKLAADTSLTLGIAAEPSAALAPTIGYGTVSTTLAIASGTSVGLAETITVGAVSQTLGIPAGTSVALALTAAESDSLILGIATAVSIANPFDPPTGITTLWPEAAGDQASVLQGAPFTGYQPTGAGLRSTGQPYFAAWQLNPAPLTSFSGSGPTSVNIAVQLDSAPVQLNSAQEPHYLFSIHEIGGAEVFSIGVTPDLRICGKTKYRPLLLSAPNVMPIDRSQHMIEMSWDGSLARILSLDGTSLVSDRVSAAGADGTWSDTGQAIRAMIFNGVASATRCAGTILSAMVVLNYPAAQIVLSKGANLGLTKAQIETLAANQGLTLVWHIGIAQAQYVTISNLGNVTLSISSITSQNGLFTVSGAPASVLAGGSAVFSISYSGSGSGISTVTIVSNDPVNGTIQIAVGAVNVGFDSNVTAPNPPLVPSRVYWPVKDSTGGVVSGMEVTGGIGAPLVAPPTLSFPTEDWRLTLGWFDPRPANPLLYGGIPITPPSTGAMWAIDTQYNRIPLAPIVYAPYSIPGTGFVPKKGPAQG